MNPRVYRTLEEGIQKLNHRFYTLVDEQERLFALRDEDADFLKVSPTRLSNYEVRAIQKEYEKKKSSPEEVNWKRIDSMVSRLQFFAGFPEDVRLTLLKDGEYRQYNRGTYIFKQGEFGDNMYVILSGACNVRTIRKNIYGTNEDIIINCLYDGDRFGELAMMGTATKSKLQADSSFERQRSKSTSPNKINNTELVENKGKLVAGSAKEAQMEAIGLKVPAVSEDDKKYFERTKRAASIQVAQASSLLCIPRDKFKTIVMGLIQKQLDSKLKVLLNIPFLEKVEPFLLIPLANNLSTKKFRMGELILKEGETPSEFCILAQGRVKVVKEMALSNMKTPVVYSRRGVPPLKSFQLKKIGECEEDTERASILQPSNSQLLKSLEAATPIRTRAFQYEVLKEDKARNKIYWKNLIEFQTLSRGDYFAGRAVLGEEIGKDEFEFQEFLKKLPKAKLSVIAESNDVQIFAINKRGLLSVPDNIKKLFVEGVAASREFDDYTIEQECQAVKEWNKANQKEVIQILKETYCQRHVLSDLKKF